MSVSVNGPKTPLTKGSNGIAMATLPNICKMPGPPAPFVPAPLPNIGKTSDKPKGYSKKVKVEKKTVAIKGASFCSMGDMASKGTGGGMLSSNTHGPCKFISPGAMDVKFEGKNVQFLTDMVTNNGGPSGSPANSATMMGAIQKFGVLSVPARRKCPVCGKKTHDALTETEESEADAMGLLNAFRNTTIEVTENGVRRQQAYMKNTMIGVVVTSCCGNKYASKSGSGDQRFSTAAERQGVHFLRQKNAQTTLARMQEHCGGNKKFNGVLNYAQTKCAQAVNLKRISRNLKARQHMPSVEREMADLSRNAPGNCAAQGALVLALDHKCTVSAMTEVFYSPQDIPTAPVKHKDINGKVVKDRVFRHAESVPPCETCNLLLPFLTCQEQSEGCGVPVVGCCASGP